MPIRMDPGTEKLVLAEGAQKMFFSVIGSTVFFGSLVLVHTVLALLTLDLSVSSTPVFPACLSPPFKVRKLMSAASTLCGFVIFISGARLGFAKQGLKVSRPARRDYCLRSGCATLKLETEQQPKHHRYSSYCTNNEPLSGG